MVIEALEFRGIMNKSRIVYRGDFGSPVKTKTDANVAWMHIDRMRHNPTEGPDIRRSDVVLISTTTGIAYVVR